MDIVGYDREQIYQRLFIAPKVVYRTMWFWLWIVIIFFVVEKIHCACKTLDDELFLLKDVLFYIFIFSVAFCIYCFFPCQLLTHIITFNYYNKQKIALADVAQWIECRPSNQRVTSLIPSQSTAWVTDQVPNRGTWEAITYWCLSPFLSPSLPLSLKVNKYFFKKNRY